jgi:hypothetical protein
MRRLNFVFVIGSLEFRICFEFRYSNFGLSRISQGSAAGSEFTASGYSILTGKFKFFNILLRGINPLFHGAGIPLEAEPPFSKVFNLHV